MNPANNFLETHNEEFIHDLSFDFFGKRIATCSSDHIIRIYSKNDKGNWVKTTSFEAHDGIIWKVKWAHPDYGSIIATCSADKTVMIWEEKKPSSTKSSTPHSLKVEEEEFLWSNRMKLFESKESIEDIKFAPKHMGLVIASASADGSVRIYEAADLMRLNSWKAPYRIEVNTLGINCISWNKNPFDPPMIAVGSKDATNSLMNKSVMKTQHTHSQSTSIENAKTGSAEDKYLSIYVYKGDHWAFSTFLSFESPSGEKIEHKYAVNDVSWNQLNGRSYHLISSCGKDGVFVWYIKITKEDNQGPVIKILDAKKVYSGVTIWKCSFNIMGTLLSFSGQDNKVRICKGGYDRSWGVVEEFEEEGIEEEDGDSNASQTDERGLNRNRMI